MLSTPKPSQKNAPPASRRLCAPVSPPRFSLRVTLPVYGRMAGVRTPLFPCYLFTRFRSIATFKIRNTRRGARDCFVGQRTRCRSRKHHRGLESKMRRRCGGTLPRTLSVQRTGKGQRRPLSWLGRDFRTLSLGRRTRRYPLGNCVNNRGTCSIADFVHW